MSENYVSCSVASAALESLGCPVHLLSLKHLWANMLWQDPFFFCLSLLPHPCKRLFFFFASFLHDRWHLGEPRAFWWPARLTETWLTREASNSQKCEQYVRCLGFAPGACGIYCSSELRWLLDLNNPSFHSSLHLLLVHLRLKEKNLGWEERCKSTGSFKRPGRHECCWGAAVAVLCRCILAVPAPISFAALSSGDWQTLWSV